MRGACVENVLDVFFSSSSVLGDIKSTVVCIGSIFNLSSRARVFLCGSGDNYEVESVLMGCVEHVGALIDEVLILHTII